MSQEVSATNNGVTVTSTTATQEEVNESVGLTADGAAVAAKEETETPETVETQVEKIAVATETVEEVENEQEEIEKKKGRGGFQRKIDKLAAEKFRLEGELKAERERRLAEETKEEPVRVLAEGEPKPEDFETTEAYIRAQTRWEVRQELATERQAAQDREVLDTYAKRVNETKANHDDWDEVYSSLGDATVPQSVQLVLIEMEEGPEIVYLLAKDAELRDSLNKMSPQRAIVEIGKLASSLSRSEKSTPTKRVVSSAPAPIKPVGGAQTKSQKPLDEMSMADYMKARDSGRTA